MKLPDELYRTHLREWVNLRSSLQDCALIDQLHGTWEFWKKFQLQNHYLHPADIEDWPSPWELLHDNLYCVYARTLGIFYTLRVLGIERIDMVESVDYTSSLEIVYLVIDGEFMLDCIDGTISNVISSPNMHVLRILNSDVLNKKIGK